MIYYRQCKLEYKGMVSVGWMEERGAKKGLHITLKDDPEKRRWLVTQVSDLRLPEQQVKAMERGYKHQRSVSDI